MDRKSITDIFPDAPAPDPARRIRAAVVKLRSLRSQVGHDGLTPAAARTLLDEVSAALEACASAVEDAQS